MKIRKLAAVSAAIICMSLSANVHAEEPTAVDIVTDSAVYGADIVSQGDCGKQGDNVKWTLDSDGVLTITGTGEMADYDDNAPYHDSSVKKVIVGSGVTALGKDAFRNMKITSVELPDSLVTINKSAFHHCSDLTSLDLPDSVTTIGTYAFSCAGLTSIDLPDSITSLGESAFEGCSALTSVKLPGGLTSLSQYTFFCCGALQNVTIPAALTDINLTTFSGCGSLAHIHIPYGTTAADYIGKGSLPTGEACYYTLSADGYCPDTNCPMGLNFVCTEHSYGEPSYTWSDYNTQCTAEIVCSMCGDKVTETADAQTDERAASCEAKGWKKYTASFYDDRFETQTLTTEYEALGHDYSGVTFHWSDDGTTCTATAVCSRDASHTNDYQGTVYSNITDPATCTESGTAVNSATFEIGWSDVPTKEVTIPALGHSYAAPVWSWSADQKTAQAVFTCDRCKTVATENAVITKSPDGKKLTASVTFEGTKYTDTADAILPAPAKATVVIRSVFGGRTVQLNCEDKDAEIYYQFGSSNITDKCAHVKAGETIPIVVPRTGTDAALFFKAYDNGKWSPVGKWGVLNVQIAKPLAVQSGKKADNNFKVYTQTKDSYIVYTLDGTVPAIEEGAAKLKVKNGRIVWKTSEVINIPKGRTIKAIAIRAGLVTSDVMTYTNK